MGVCVSLQFFDDVWVPVSLLREGMKWRVKPAGGGCWYWEHSVDGEVFDLAIDVGDRVLIRVASVVFGEPTERSALGDRPSGTKGGAKVFRDGLIKTPGQVSHSEGISSSGVSSSACVSVGVSNSAETSSSLSSSSLAKVAPPAQTFLAGGEPGDGAHVPLLSTAVGGSSSSNQAPSLEATPSLRRRLGQSAAARGVSSLDAVLGFSFQGNSAAHSSLPRALQGNHESLSEAAKRQFRSIIGEDEGFLRSGARVTGLVGGSSAIPDLNWQANRQVLTPGSGGKNKSSLPSPLLIYASINEDGLGNVKWWDLQE